MNKNSHALNLILPLLTILAVVILWAVSSAIIDSEYILPSVMETLSSTLAVLGSGEFYRALIDTLLRCVIAFAISFLVGGVCAYFSSRCEAVRKCVQPLISILRAMPTIAIVLLLLFWTNSYVAPIIVTVLVVLPTVYSQLKYAFDTVDNSAKEASMVDGAGKKEVFKHIELPLISPAIFSTIGSGVTLTLKLMVAAEVIAQTANSIGYMLNTSKVYFEIANMLALVLIVIVLGIIIEGAFEFISKRIKDWE